MKKQFIFTLITILFFTGNIFSQVKVGNNPTVIGTSSVLEIESTNKGVVFPRMTGAQMNAIASPVSGMYVYNTDSLCICQYNGLAWRSMCGGNIGAPQYDWHLTGNSGTNASTNFIGTIDAVDFIAKTTNTERMRIASGGKIGIAGVAVPTYDFSINGDAGRAIGMERSSLGAGNFMTVRSGSALAGGTDLNGGSLNLVSGVSTGTGNSAVRFYTSTPAAISGTTDNNLTQKMIVMGNGNVGIGTGNPLAQLSVTRSAAAVPATSGTATTAIGRFEAQNNALDIGAFTAAPYGNWLQSTAASDLSINSPISLNPNGGYVGIGSIAPSSKLELLNNGVGGANDDIGIKSFGSGKSPKLFMETAAGTYASPSNLSASDDLGGIEYWGRTNGTSKILNSITNKYKGNGTTDSSEMNVTTSGVEHFRLDAKGRIMQAINTTVIPNGPMTSYHMYGDGTSGYNLLGTSSIPNPFEGPEIGFSRGGFYSGVAAAIQLIDYDAYSGGLAFLVHKGTNNGGGGVYADNWPTDVTQAMTIVNNGKIGIGTGDPKTLLHVNGGLVLNDLNAVTITSDNFLVTVGDASYLRLTSNNNTAANRTLILSDGLGIGQILFIENAGGGSTSFEIADNAGTNNTNTAATRAMGPGDVIQLIWNGTDWLEVSFANN